MKINVTVKQTKTTPEGAQVLFDLGSYLELGIGLERDYAAALELFKIAGAAGHSEAMNRAGWLYLHGLGVQRDIDKAYQWFAKAARKGNPAAMSNLGDILAWKRKPGQGANYKAALKWYRRAAEKEDQRARLGLAKMYHYGCGVRQDYQQAGTAFLELAQARNVEAYVYVGLHLQHGFYFPANYDAALNVYELGASLDDAPCMRQLGEMYALGLGVEQDYKTAFYWYQKAAAAGEPEAMHKLAAMYEGGRGVRKNIKKAQYWHAQAEQA